MRRGLMRRDAEELPVEALQQRLARLRERMRRDRLDALLIYTNLVRPSAVCWVTGFTPYWSEGALLVDRDGAPLFSTALSKRVADWIQSTNPLSDVANAPRPGKLLGERVSADPSIRRLGVLELDDLPSGLAGDLADAAPSVALVDASGLFADLRRKIDEPERKLLLRADSLASKALDQVNPKKAMDAGAVAGLVEQEARRGGAEEAYIAVAPDLDADRRLNRISRPTPLGQRLAVRASVAYKGAWVRRTRSFAKDSAGGAAFKRAEAWFAGLIRGLDSGKPLAEQMAAYSKAHPEAQVRSWMVETCIGSYPLQVIAASSGSGAAMLGDFAVVTVEASVDGVPWLGAAPVFPRS